MTISDTARSHVFAQESEGFLIRLVIDHDSLGAPIRFVNNTVNITSGGQLYVGYPFDLTLPDERDGTTPAAKITIDNVDRQIVQVIRQISTPPSITITVVRTDDVDTVELTLPVFQLRNVNFDALTISGDLIIDDIQRESFPARAFTPGEYPGLFSG